VTGLNKSQLLVLTLATLFLLSSVLPPETLASSSTVDWWPTFGHTSDGTRVSTSKGPRTDQLLWTMNVGTEVRSSVAVVDGVVYCGGGFDGSVFAVNANMGILLWRVKIGDKVWASPTVVNDKVYVGNMEGMLYALNVYTGETVWSYPTKTGMFNGPAVIDGAVYQIQNDGVVYALDAESGALKWSHNTTATIRCTPAVVKGILYFVSAGASSGFIYALRASDGEELWSFQTGPGESSYQDSSPAIEGGVVYVGSPDGYLYALDASSGAKVWSFGTGGKVSSSPAVLNGVVYVGSEDGNVYALNASTGVKIWQYDVGSPVYSSPSIADGLLYIGEYGGSSVLALNLMDGSVAWSHPIEYVFASPAIANGVLYVGGYDQVLYAFGSPDNKAWATDFDYPAIANMTAEGWALTNSEGINLVPGGGIILDSSKGVSEISYLQDIPAGIYDWKVDVTGMWLGGGHCGINEKLVTVRHTYLWAVDGEKSQYVFSRDGVEVFRVNGYFEALNEKVTLTIERNGAYIGFYSNGKFIKSYNELDSQPSEVTGVSFSSGTLRGSRIQLSYAGAFVPNARTFPDANQPPTQFVLKTSVIGQGSIVKTPEKPSYGSGEQVQCTAVPEQGYIFSTWGGDASGTSNTVKLVIEKNMTITATFQKIPDMNSTLITTKISNGTAVSSSKITINYLNSNQSTTKYEVKVDGGAWVNTGSSTSYTASGLSLGDHSIEVRAVDADGGVVDSQKVNFVVDVWVPPASNAVASGVVIASSIGLISAVASAASNTMSTPLSWLWEKINSLLPDGVKGWLESFLSSKRQLIIDNKTGSIFTLSRFEILSYLASLVVLTFAFCYSGAYTLDDFVLLIPTVLATSVLVGLVKNLLTEIYARKLGVWAEHHLWYFGLSTFIISTILFRAPFSSPSRIVSHTPKSTPRSQGLVATASVIIGLLFAAIFYAALSLGYTYIGSIGFGMCILGALYDILPITPMNGRDIYDWSKPIWIAQSILVLSVYIAWLLYL
jgi:outer membrane protein assembly factor BamB